MLEMGKGPLPHGEDDQVMSAAFTWQVPVSYRFCYGLSPNTWPLRLYTKYIMRCQVHASESDKCSCYG